MRSERVLYIALVVLILTGLIVIYFPSTRITWNRFIGIFSSTVRPNLTTTFTSEALTSVLPPPHLRKNTSDVGYVLATHYSDQLTGSTANVISLQCWASTVPGNVRVVEPFLHYGSILGFDLNPYTDIINKSVGCNSPRYRRIHENTIKVSDIFDVVPWNNFISAHHFAPFISWRYFIQHAPRHLIIVDQVHEAAMCMKCESNDFLESNLFLKFAEQFAEFYKFQLVRKICYHRKTYSQNEFQDLVYGSQSPQDSVVIFNHFGGLDKNGNRFRTRVDLDRCNRGNWFLSVRSSPQILRKSALYIERYMPHARISGYVCIMVRLERIALAHGFATMSKKQQNTTISKCIEQIVKEVNKVRKKGNISEVFISTDIGKYGSIGLRKYNKNNHYDLLLDGLDRLYKLLLGNMADREKMMARVDAVVPVQSPGYVAQLEKSIAANATCLVLVGGGTFQKTVKNLYNTQYRETRLHRDCGIKQMRCK